MLWHAIYIYKILQASPWTHSILQIMWIVFVGIKIKARGVSAITGDCGFMYLGKGGEMTGRVKRVANIFCYTG